MIDFFWKGYLYLNEVFDKIIGKLDEIVYE